MWWRLPTSKFMRNRGESNRTALKEIVNLGRCPGILAYTRKQPIGWCALALREEYPKLNRSHILKRVDEEPVWSVVCFFVDKKFRRSGLTVKLLEAAKVYVEDKGGAVIEGYPLDLKAKKTPADAFAYTGLLPAFLKAGFVEVARRSQNRPIMRFRVGTHCEEGGSTKSFQNRVSQTTYAKLLKGIQKIDIFDTPM
jgi:GNAT superfamily N-acetyltransferase